MSSWLCRKIRKWLGIDSIQTVVNEDSRRLKDLALVGIDLNFHEQSTMVILSKLGGGQCRIIPHRFNDLRELDEVVKMLTQTYNTTNVIYDEPFMKGRRF